MDESIKTGIAKNDPEPLNKTEITVTAAPLDVENDSDKSNEPQSEYLEIRAAVDVGDDVSMPAETFRAYTIGLILTLLGSTISNITSLREQPLVIDASLIQLISLPIGRLWARCIPKKTISLGFFSFQLNPGPFTIKEHTLIVVMANVGAGYPPYAVGLILVQMIKYSKFTQF
jgi:hypothetical protein